MLCIFKEDLQADTNIQDINTETKLSLNLTSSRQTITPATDNRKLELVCTISSSDGTGARAPLSMCVVVDVSGSMNLHMQTMKSTLKALVDMLQPCDRLCIVTFSNEGRVELKLTATDYYGKNTARNIISNLRVTGSTNIEDGISKAINEFRTVRTFLYNSMSNSFVWYSLEINCS